MSCTVVVSDYQKLSDNEKIQNVTKTCAFCFNLNVTHSIAIVCKIIKLKLG